MGWADSWDAIRLWDAVLWDGLIFGVRLCPGLLFQRAVKARDWDAVTFTIRWGQRRHTRRDRDEVSCLSHYMMFSNILYRALGVCLGVLGVSVSEPFRFVWGP